LVYLISEVAGLVYKGEIEDFCIIGLIIRNCEKFGKNISRRFWWDFALIQANSFPSLFIPFEEKSSNFL